MPLISDMRALSLATAGGLASRSALLICLGATLGLRAESVTLHPMADTSLFEMSPNNNLGGVTTLVSGTTAGELGGAGGPATRSRALVRFDVASQLPPSATVTSVTFTVSVVKAPALGGGVSSTFDLHKVLQPWGEGAKFGGSTLGQTATDGEATWNARQHPSTLWTSPGAAAGTDYESTAAASKLIGGIASYTFDSTSNLVADVRLWLSAPESNFGWILISQLEDAPSTARRFGSRESTNAPVLVVEYTTQPVVEPPLMTQIGLAGGQMSFQFGARAQTPYTIEFNGAMGSTNWLTFTNVPPQSANTNVLITDSIANTQRFYRVRSP